MRVATIVALIIALVGLLITAFFASGVGNSSDKIAAGLSKAEGGIAAREWEAVAAGVDQVHWADKNLWICHTLHYLSLAVSGASVAVALVLAIWSGRPNPEKHVPQTPAENEMPSP